MLRTASCVAAHLRARVAFADERTLSTIPATRRRKEMRDGGNGTAALRSALTRRQ